MDLVKMLYGQLHFNNRQFFKNFHSSLINLYILTTYEFDTEFYKVVGLVFNVFLIKKLSFS